MANFNEKEKRIFTAVLALAGRGVDMKSVKMQEIAAEANFGKSTLYEYFTSKEELLHATMSYCLQQEVELLGPQVERCSSLNQLLDVLFDYAEGLVQERVAAYGMMGQVFGGSREAERCPMMEEVTKLFWQLVDFAAGLAKMEALQAEDREYLSHVLFSTLMSYSVAVLRMKNTNQLTVEQREILRSHSRKMLLNALH